MVRLLFLKTARDLKRSAVTYFISVLIVTVGLCGYGVLSLCADRLTASRDSFFEETSFAEVFAELKSAPIYLEERLMQIEGVDRAEGRITATVRADALQKGAELKLISFRREGLNRPRLSVGTLPNKGKTEAVVGDGLMAAHAIAAGDRINVTIGGKSTPITVSGGGISPENIYMIKGMTDMLPDFATYDAAFFDYDTLSAMLGRDFTANEFMMTLKPGYELKDVKWQIESILEPYGLYTLYDRGGQLSASMLKSELDQLANMSRVIPFLFLLVACVILYITLFRLVEQQRTQAGTLMAMGIDHRTVSLHYMGYGGLVGLFGGLFGGVLGIFAADPMYDYYRTYFSLPDTPMNLPLGYLMAGVLASTVFCGAVGFWCARGLMLLSPSQALRPAPPRTTRRSFLERVPAFVNMLTVPGLMAVRSLSRNRRRAALSLLGVVCAYMITASLVSMYTLFDVFIFDYLESTQRQDISISFTRPLSRNDAMEAARDHEAELIEGILELPVKLSSHKGEMDATITALSTDARLTRIYYEGGLPIHPEGEGIVLSRHMANLLGVGRGTLIEVEVTYPEKRATRVPVSAIADQYVGATAYMSIEGAGRVSGYGDACTTVLLKAPPHAAERILKRLDSSPVVLGVQSRADKINMYRSMMGSVEGIMASMAMLGVLIGLAVIYVSSLISFEELKREVSTMMMLGMESRQCLSVISTGQWILTAGGILGGVPVTMGIGRLLSVSLASELYTIPDFTDAASLFFAALLTLAAVALSSEIMHAKLKKLSPVELLRERE